MSFFCRQKESKYRSAAFTILTWTAILFARTSTSWLSSAMYQYFTFTKIITLTILVPHLLNLLWTGWYSKDQFLLRGITVVQTTVLWCQEKMWQAHLFYPKVMENASCAYSCCTSFMENCLRTWVSCIKMVSSFGLLTIAGMLINSYLELFVCLHC